MTNLKREVMPSDYHSLDELREVVFLLSALCGVVIGLALLVAWAVAAGTP